MDSRHPKRPVNDLETASLWARDPSSEATTLDDLYTYWPNVHHLLAANPSTPTHVLEELAMSTEPAVLRALTDNPSARGLGIKPRALWDAPNAAEVSDTSLIERKMLAIDVAEAKGPAAATGTFAAAASSADTSATTAVPTVEDAMRAEGIDATQLDGVPQVSSEGTFVGRLRRLGERGTRDGQTTEAGATVVVEQDRPRGLAAIGPLGVLALFATIAVFSLAVLVNQLVRNTGRQKATSNTQIIPPNPNSTVASGSSGGGTAASVLGATQENTPAPSAEPVTTAAPAAPATTTPPPAPPAPTLDPPTTKATVAATSATTSSAIKQTSTTVNKTAAETARAGQIAQEYANALARADGVTVQKINPTKSADLSGYRYLTSSTVLPIGATANGSGRYTMKLGLVAQEKPPSGDVTKLFCAVWVVDTTSGQVSEQSGRLVRSVTGLVSASKFTSELQKACG